MAVGSACGIKGSACGIKGSACSIRGTACGHISFYNGLVLWETTCTESSPDFVCIV